MSIYPDNIQWTDIPNTKASNHFPFHCRKFPAGRYYRAHRHDFLELSFIVAGHGYQMIDNKRFEMKPGTFMFFLPYQIQEMITVSEERIILYNCLFDLQFLLSSHGPGLGFEPFLTVEGTPSIQLTKEEGDSVENLFDKLAEEYSNDHIWRKQMIVSLLWEILIIFDRLRTKKHPHPQPDLSYPLLNIWSVIRYVHMHYREPITLESLARQIAISTSYLSEQFKEKLGLSFTQFLQEIRIRHACSLLTSTEMSMVDIAIEVGFGSLRSFFRIFKQHKEMTPTEYRNRLKNG